MEFQYLRPVGLGNRLEFWKNKRNNCSRIFHDRFFVMSKSKSKKSSERSALGRRVDLERATHGYSVESVAKRSGYCTRTVRNFIQGRSTRPRTQLEICKAVGIDLEEERASKRIKQIKAADTEHGIYTQDLLREYVGFFYAYRRSFQDTANVIRSLYEFFWSDSSNCLRFKETHRYHSIRLGRLVNYDQEGDVYASNSIGLMHLLTKFEGALRLITMTKLHHEQQTMSGIVLTQAERPNHFEPAASPIYLRKVAGDRAELARHIGIMSAGDPDLMAINANLAQVEQNVAHFALSSGAQNFSDGFQEPSEIIVPPEQADR